MTDTTDGGAEVAQAIGLKVLPASCDEYITSVNASRSQRDEPAPTGECKSGLPVYVPAACLNAGSNQFGVSWTETLGADPMTG